MTIVAIDPGNEKSGYVVIAGNNPKPIGCGIVHNGALIEILFSISPNIILCEWIESYGMSVGKTVFQTCEFIEYLRGSVSCDEFILIGRKDIKIHHCKSMRAKDTNIRQALIDKYGDKGTKDNQGITYGLSSHMWSAYAMAMYYVETGGNIEVAYEPNF